MKSKKKKKVKSMDELTSNYEKFIKGKELNPNGKELFENAIKKAATTKQHDSK